MRRRLHPFASVVVPALLVLGLGPTAVKAQAQSSASTISSATIEWSGCTDPVDRANHLECSTLRLPVDYSRPDGAQFDLAIVREPARNPAARIGSLIVNNGGPGKSPIAFLNDALESNSLFSSVIRDRFDLVAFDPRGVLRSRGVTCDEKMPPQSGPFAGLAGATGQAVLATAPSDDERAAILDRAQRAAIACSSHEDPDFLKNLTTNNSANDLERVREALGDEQLTFLGFGYGTYLGATYAARYPDQVRALVLDGPVDPERYAREPLLLGVEQAAAANQALVDVLDSCRAAAQGCRFGGGQPVEAFDRLIEQLSKQPIDLFFREEKIAFTADSLRAAMSKAVTLPPDRWPAVLNALSSLEAGDPTPLLALVDDQKRNSFSNPAELLTECNDQAYPKDQREWDALIDRRLRVAPQLGRLTMFANVECSYLNLSSEPFAGPFSTTSETPVLVIGGVKDPQNPYAWAQAMTAQLGNARLLTFNGVGHVSYQPNHQCIREHVDAYLVDRTLPSDGTACAQSQVALPLD